MGHTAYDRATNLQIKELLNPIYSTKYVKDFELAESIGFFKVSINFLLFNYQHLIFDLFLFFLIFFRQKIILF